MRLIYNVKMENYTRYVLTAFELPIIRKLFQNRVKTDFRIVNFMIEESPLEQDRTAFGYSFKH